MTGQQHHYRTRVIWTGNRGQGTASYRGYDRSHRIEAEGKPPILGSSDPAFRGDAACWNPEDMLVASVSACHKLWYLALCAQAGVIVTAYEDEAEGVMAEEADGAGQFVSITLRPRVRLAPGSDAAKAAVLHEKAHAMCFIARSLNFPVTHDAVTILGEP
jgi:organic hydroperoxide reductase OsmC/OhrA